MRSLVRWDPISELTNWHRDIDDLFRRFVSDDRDEANFPLLTHWSPAMESFESDGRYVLRTDLPGVDPKDVEISVLEDSLVLRGERKSADEVKNKDYHYRETAYGTFERHVALPKGIDRDKITARFENGVLEISMPLPESVKVKKVPIEIGTTQAKQIKAA